MQSAATETQYSIVDKAKQLHERALVWDQTFPASLDCGTWPDHHRALERMRASGYDVVSMTIGVDPDNTLDSVQRISMWRKYLAENTDRYVLMLNADDAEAAKKAGKLAVGMHFQGTTPFARDIGLVEVFYALGIRHALMAYNQKNNVGDGCHERTDGGLSRFGMDLVREMERVGMVVDCTHTGSKTSLDVFEMATKPVIYSHSNSAVLWDHQRNISDDLARACAKTGGVVGINGIGVFLGENDDSTEALFRHVDHFVQLLGSRHVAIGLDSVSDTKILTATVHSRKAMYPAGQNYEEDEFKVVKPEQIPELTELMVRANYSDEDVMNVLGENWMRIAREVWK